MKTPASPDHDAFSGIGAAGETVPSIQPPRFDVLNEYLEWHARERPSTQAAVVGEQRYTYAQLHDAVDRYARALVASGVEPGDRVATLSTPHPDFLIQFLAASSIGAIWLGLNPKYQPAEYGYVLEDSRPRILFTRSCIGSRQYARELQELDSAGDALELLVVLDRDGTATDTTPVDDFLLRADAVTKQQLNLRRAQVKPKDPALIVYTSGSTGRPKGAMISHYGLITCALNQIHHWPATPLRMVNFLPINHIGCVGDISCYLLLGGGTNLFMEHFDPQASLELMERERATVWAGVPTSLQMCVDVPRFERYDLSSLQLIVWSGAAASRQLVTRLRQVCPRLSTSYGMTETVGSVTYTGTEADNEVLARTIGTPSPAFELRLVNEKGQPAAPGEPGEIQVRGEFLMTGYWNRPQETAEVFDPHGWMATGDLAVQRPDGHWQLVGRMREMFKSGGYNVYPREIEQAIESHPAVALAAVIDVPDPTFQEVGWAYVCLNPEAVLTDAELAEHCRQQLANYKVPKRFFIVDGLPTLPIGKVDKPKLRAEAAAYRSRR